MGLLWKMRRKTKLMVAQSGIKLKVKFEKLIEALATYDPGRKEIAVDRRCIIREAHKLGYNPQELLEVTIAHELGHALDEALLPLDEFVALRYKPYRMDNLKDALKAYEEYRETVLGFEIRANELGQRFTDSPLYDKSNEDSLRAYRDFLDDYKIRLINHFEIRSLQR